MTAEHQIGDLLLSAAYVGTRGVHLLRASSPNLGLNATPVINQIVSDTSVPQFIGTTLPPNQTFSLRPFPLLGTITVFESDANSIFHSLQLEALQQSRCRLQKPS